MPVPPPPLPAELQAAARAFDRAQAAGDRAALERLMAEDFVLVNGGGRAETKAQYIADLTDPDVREDPLAVIEPVQSVWAGGAVLGGLALLSGADHGVRFSARVRFANVWTLADGRWRVVYSHMMKAAE